MLKKPNKNFRKNPLKNNNFKENEPDISWEIYCKEVEENEKLKRDIYELTKEIKKQKDKIFDLEDNLNNQDKIINNKDKKIDELNKKNEENIKTINEQKITINNQKELISLKFINWSVEGGSAMRTNPITLKREIYDVPQNFEAWRVIKPKPDENFEMVTYKHIDNMEYRKINKYCHPISLYTQMGGIFFLNDRENIEKQKISIIDLLKRKMSSKGLLIRGEKFNEALKFIIDNPGKIFYANEFDKQCKINNRGTRRTYLKNFLKIGIIREISKGVYEIIFQC